MDPCVHCTTATTATGCRIPPRMAATLIAQMRDDNGRILIPGFSDDGVRALTPAGTSGAAQHAACRAMN